MLQADGAGVDARYSRFGNACTGKEARRLLGTCQSPVPTETVYCCKENGHWAGSRCCKVEVVFTATAPLRKGGFLVLPVDLGSGLLALDRIAYTCGAGARSHSFQGCLIIDTR